MNSLLLIFLSIIVLSIIFYIIPSKTPIIQKYTLPTPFKQTLPKLKSEEYPNPPSFSRSKEELEQIANKFSPIYIFSKDERYYPANLTNVVEWCSLRKAVKYPNTNKVQRWDTLVPAGKLNYQIIVGLLDTLPQEDIQALKFKEYKDPTTNESRLIQVFNDNYALVLEPPQNVDSNFDDALMTHQSRIAGNLQNPDFHPKYNKTWYHQGCPGCPTIWKNNGMKCPDFAQTILEKNKLIDWKDNPQFCTIQQKQIFKNGIFQFWVTDFIYVTYLGFNGSISIIPDEGTHFIDIEVSAVRFLSDDINKNGLDAKPFRYYTATHSGQSWWTPDKVLLRKLELSTPRKGDSGSATHPVIYWGRESHEGYVTSTPDVRIFGIGNDALSGGVVWQPGVFMVDIPQDSVAHNIRKDFMKKIPGHSYFQTYVFPKNYTFTPNDPNLWLFYAGRIRPQSGSLATMYPDKIRLNEGQCVGTPEGDCVASSSEPSAPVGTYNPPGCAPPLGDFEEWDSENMWYKPVPVNCLKDYARITDCYTLNEDCCMKSNNYSSPKYVYAITDVKLFNQTNGQIPPQTYTGVQFNNVTKPFIPGVVGYRNKADDVNSTVGGDNVTLYLKYDKVDVDSDTNVLTYMTVSHWSDWHISCPPNLYPVDKLNPKTNDACDRNGLCASFAPIKTLNSFISAVAWSFSENDVHIDFVANVNGQNIRVAAAPNWVSRNVQDSCCSSFDYFKCTQKYLYLCLGGNTIYRSQPPPPSKNDIIITKAVDCDSSCKDGPCYANGKCCMPNCTNKNCGDDGCGGSCGECKIGQDCNLDTGTCYDSPTVPTYVNFEKDKFGQFLVENLNKYIFPFLMYTLANGMGSDVGKPEVDQIQCSPNTQTPNSNCPCCVMGRDTFIENKISPGKCACWFIQSIPKESSLYVYASHLKGGTDEISDGIHLKPIIGIINNLKFLIQPVDDTLVATVISGPLKLETSIYVSSVDTTLFANIHLDDGLYIRLAGKYKLTSTKNYKYGFVQNTTWFYPPNKSYCDMTKETNKKLFSPYDPCKDFQASDFGENPLEQGFGWHVKPEALLTGMDYAQTNNAIIKLVATNINKIKVKINCPNLLQPVCSLAASVIEDLASDVLNKFTSQIENQINTLVNKLLAYPP